MDISAKIIHPRLLHGSQWGIIDPVDTPDGGNVGLHKHLAIATHITNGCSNVAIIAWLRKNGMQLLEECFPLYLAEVTKIFVNGAWVGVIDEPVELMKLLKLYRRIGLIAIFTSVEWNIAENTIYVYTDAGRPCRPLFYIDEDTKKASYDKQHILKKIEDGDFTWLELITGFTKKKIGGFNPYACKMYEPSDLYADANVEKLKMNAAIIEYIDTAEEESAYVAMHVTGF